MIARLNPSKTQKRFTEMALASCRMVVRASWDTQQIQPYNRNAPRKTNKKNKNKNQKSDLLSLFKPSTPTRTSQDNQSLKFDVDDLLNFKHPTISLQGILLSYFLLFV